ncbi:MAG TPA: hypothetical protein VJ852_06985 [Gemmatimonadaceae bacterium]|nr:hypothetical protein [Gemmatimonadaceae bacterium]
MPSILHSFAAFSAIDGVLALLLAVLILAAGWYRVLAALAGVDGLIRVCAALFVWFGKGMLSFPITLVLYLGVLATLAFLLALMRLSAAGRLYGELGKNPWTLVLIAQGVLIGALAAVAFFAAPDPARASRLLAFGEVINALALLAVGLRVSPPATRLAAR